MSRRQRKILRRQGKKYQSDKTIETGPAEHKPEHTGTKKRQHPALKFYEHNYKKAMWFTIILLVLSIIVIGVHTAMTGELIPRGVSLKGGVTITVPTEDAIDTDSLQTTLRNRYPQASINVRAMSSAGSTIGFIVDASDVDPEELLDTLQDEVGSFEKFSMETMGSALGQAFFKQTLIAVLIAFVLMSIVVFLSFKTFVPSFAVILSAVSDIAMTVAVIDLFGIRIETAGIAALLMLIGYSVDTDVLLTTRVIKREEGTVFERVIGAMKTGMTMTLTSIAAISVALIFTQSETLRQIMLILLIGLIFDIFNTWIQNAGILRMYMEHRSQKRAKAVLADYEKPRFNEKHEKVHDAVYEEVEKELDDEEKHRSHHVEHASHESSHEHKHETHHEHKHGTHHEHKHGTHHEHKSASHEGHEHKRHEK